MGVSKSVHGGGPGSMAPGPSVRPLNSTPIPQTDSTADRPSRPSVRADRAQSSREPKIPWEQQMYPERWRSRRLQGQSRVPAHGHSAAREADIHLAARSTASRRSPADRPDRPGPWRPPALGSARFLRDRESNRIPPTRPLQPVPLASGRALRAPATRVKHSPVTPGRFTSPEVPRHEHLQVT